MLLSSVRADSPHDFVNCRHHLSEVFFKVNPSFLFAPSYTSFRTLDWELIPLFKTKEYIDKQAEIAQSLVFPYIIYNW
jgi:hypothetical protein